jgi:epoxide hydrolase-like predicted phosphatase
VLFDFGGVFIDSPFADLDPEVAFALFGPYDRDTDHPWHRLERGEITFAEAQREIGDPIEQLASMMRSLEVRDFAVDAVQRYRGAGLRTGIITNNLAEFGSTWRSLIDVDGLFDDVVDSSAVGMRKPDPRIFALACERLEVEAGRTAFIDDFEGNVVGARAAGLLAVCCGYTVESTRAAFDELDAIVRSS